MEIAAGYDYLKITSKDSSNNQSSISSKKSSFFEGGFTYHSSKTSKYKLTYQQNNILLDPEPSITAEKVKYSNKNYELEWFRKFKYNQISIGGFHSQNNYAQISSGNLDVYSYSQSALSVGLTTVASFGRKSGIAIGLKYYYFISNEEINNLEVQDSSKYSIRMTVFDQYRFVFTEFNNHQISLDSLDILTIELLFGIGFKF